MVMEWWTAITWPLRWSRTPRINLLRKHKHTAFPPYASGCANCR